jgi:hypothetical protein
MDFRKKREDKVWLSAVAGALGGLLGSWTMNQFQAGMVKLQKPQPKPQGEPATVKVAEGISQATMGHHLTPREKKQAEPLVHYGVGTLVGAVYGAMAAKVPVTKAGSGTVYGAAVWLVADEIGVPMAGLSKPPQQVPVEKHLEALASHLVYGLTVEGVRWLAGITRFA